MFVALCLLPSLANATPQQGVATAFIAWALLGLALLGVVLQSYRLHRLQQAMTQAQRQAQRAEQAYQLSQAVAKHLLSEDFQPALNNSLECIGNALKVERCYVLAYYQQQRKFTMSHEWCAAQVRSVLAEWRELSLDTADYAYLHETVLNGDVAHCLDVAQLPQEAASLKTLLAAQEAQSVLLVPIQLGGKSVACLGLETHTPHPPWQPEELRRLTHLADLLALRQATHTAEQRLHTSEQRLKKSQRIGQTGNFVWDIHHENQGYWSEQVYHICGLDPTQAARLGNPVLQQIDAVDRSGLQEAVLKALQTQQAVQTEIRIRRADGELRYLSLHMELQYDPRGNPIQLAGLISDLTAQKRAEKALLQARADAEQANQFKSEFLANMSHSIRTPLNSIIGLSHLTLHTELSQKQTDYVQKIRHSAYELFNSLNDLLLLTQIETRRLQLDIGEFRWQETLDTLLQSLRYQAQEKGKEIFVQQPDNIPNVLLGDSLKLGQILHYLLCDSINSKSSKTHLQITHATKTLPSDSSIALRFVIYTGDEYLQHKENQLDADLHNANFSIKNKYSKTPFFADNSLGLNISKHLLAMMDSDIEIYSAPDQGTRMAFNICFEIATVPTTAPSKSVNDLILLQSADSQAFQQQVQDCNIPTGHILVAEDDAGNAQVIAELLRTAGQRVTSVGNGREALRAVAENPFDLIFMDLEMPYLDGFQTTENLRRDPRFSSLPIIAMTAHTLPEDVEKCLAVGMNDHCAKPFTPDTLLHLLVRWLVVARVHNDAIKSTVPTVITTNEAHSMLKPAPQLFNKTLALQRMLGKQAVLEKMCHLFIQEHGNDVTKLASSIAEKNFSQTQTLAHSLKGLSGSLGAEVLQANAERIELLAREEKLNEASEEWQVFKQDFAQTLERLQRFLDETSS